MFPKVSEAHRLKLLEPPTGRIRMVLDTDTYNEIDDQFAVVYALLSPEKLTVEAIYAAPFHNDRSTGPEDGMERSYDEILRLLERLNVRADGLVYKGSRAYLESKEMPQQSPAAHDLVQRALASTPDDPLYVVEIAAITTVASAILIEPSIIDRIVVVWLGGNALHWETAREFNLKQDIAAAQVIFNCGVPLVMLPCMGVVSHLHTSVQEVDTFVRGCGAIGDYLAVTFAEYRDHYKIPAAGYSKVVWDIATIAYLLDSRWVPTQLVHSPILTENCTWSADAGRHFIRYAYYIHRDPIFHDLFNRLAALK
jgi:inosine-uridine nucleoside N-ribohydrolase